MSNVGSEQTFENLVDKILDQLKKSMTFEISECLGSQYYHSLLNFFLIKICSELLKKKTQVYIREYYLPKEDDAVL